MSGLLKQKYESLLEYCGMKVNSDEESNIYTTVRIALSGFVEKCKNPAIWCYGRHTKLLMSDFIFEMKKVQYIIDNKKKSEKGSGFIVINESEIHEKGIDGIIVSSYVYKDEIIARIKEEYGDVPYLDIYEELAKAGNELKGTYYSMGTPYGRYIKLNALQRRFRQEKGAGVKEKILRDILQIYIQIKDFRSAIMCAKKLSEMCRNTGDQLLKLLEEIYDLQLETMETIESNNVLMLCIDGLRRKDITETCMEKLSEFLQETHYYCNAYALSTSTFESLLPAYSENDDLRTKYYETDKVPEGGCRFINEAKRQERKIFFYTDGHSYIEDNEIMVTLRAQTATEKLWDFLMDASEEKNGLFYIHNTYESHFSYPNPYTENEIIAEGTNILFDFLETNGGQIRTDYVKQQRDALRYLDDVVVPLIKRLHCRMVLYADHGNILFGKNAGIDNIEETKYTFHEELIQIPIAVRCPEMKPERDEHLVSLMEINNIIISLLNQEEISIDEQKVIKVLRSEIYNPDFRYLYQSTGNAHGLLAFEVFIFDEGYKLAIFADGTLELYETETDRMVQDAQIVYRLLDMVRDRITVCVPEQIKH